VLQGVEISADVQLNKDGSNSTTYSVAEAGACVGHTGAFNPTDGAFETGPLHDLGSIGLDTSAVGAVSGTVTISNDLNNGDADDVFSLSANVVDPDPANRDPFLGGFRRRCRIGTVHSPYDGISDGVANGLVDPENGNETLGTIMELLDGSNTGAPEALHTIWRARNNETDVDEPAVSGHWTENGPDGLGPEGGYLLSDVVDLTGIEADIFVLQMSYHPEELATSLSEEVMAARGEIYVALNQLPDIPDPDDPYPDPDLTEYVDWVNAGDPGRFWNQMPEYVGDGSYAAWFASLGIADPGGDFFDDGDDLSPYLGTWGVDTATHQAWVITDHNSEFAVIPEPGGLLILLSGGLVLLLGWRRRRRA